MTADRPTGGDTPDGRASPAEFFDPLSAFEERTKEREDRDKEIASLLRDTAKWLTGGIIVTVGAVIAGTSLSSFGGLEFGARLLIASLAAICGLASLGYLLWHCTEAIILPNLNSEKLQTLMMPKWIRFSPSWGRIWSLLFYHERTTNTHCPPQGHGSRGNAAANQGIRIRLGGGIFSGSHWRDSRERASWTMATNSGSLCGRAEAVSF